MKKILLLILIISLAVVLTRRGSPTPPEPVVSPSPIDELSSIIWKDKTYRFAWFEAEDLEKLNLYPNTEAKTSQDLIDTHQCRFLSSGGFYQPNHQPLGWLVSQGQELSVPIISRLLDGFLAISDQAVIDFTQSEEPVRSAVQSGPMLVFESAPLNLDIANDELRRRVVALFTVDQKLIFLTIVGQGSELSGPYLADLPNLVLAISGQLRLSVSEAINLDGGTASAFYTDQVYLQELNPIGNAWCYN